MNTVTQSDILDWCTRIREAWQHAAEDDDLRTVLSTAAGEDVHPARPAWAEKFSIDAMFYPELTVTFSARQTVGEVTVTAVQTSAVFIDTCADENETFIGGDVRTERICIYVDPAEFTTDTAHDLITATRRLLTKLALADHATVPPVVFMDSVNGTHR